MEQDPQQIKRPPDHLLPDPVPHLPVESGTFPFGVIGLEHGHILSMCRGLCDAGATIKWVFDPDPFKAARFVDQFPEARIAREENEILDDPEVLLIAAAAVPSQRCALGLRVMAAGKDYFTDKAPFTTLDQVAQARQACAETRRKYAVYYCERLHSECAIHAGVLIQRGAIGRVLHVLGTGPHRLESHTRPEWFFQIDRYGGILCDIGSHQAEQFLYYTGAPHAEVQCSRVANYAHPQYPEFQDFGDATLHADNGATGYFRVDWFTPDGLSTWGDGRTFILGTNGYIELRKYLDLARAPRGDHFLVVTQEGEYHLDLHGRIGYPYFPQLIRDCLHRTEIAMPQEHAFRAAELSLQAQQQAIRIA